MHKELFLILHNIRSAHNVGALFRTADGVGVTKIFLTGYTPAPAGKNSLFPTAAQKMIAKTALGAEEQIAWEHKKSVSDVIDQLKADGVQVVALEQTKKSVDYRSFIPQFPSAMIVGNEPKGLDQRTIQKCDAAIEIPMRGSKESLNVSVAAGVALYELMKKLDR